MHRDSTWWYVFVLAFVATALAETFVPLRSSPSPTSRRWISNSILFVVSQAALLFAYQFSGIALAFTIRAASRGVLNRAAIPYAWQFIVGFAALDLTAYVTHRLFHSLALMWRVHRVHHSETDLDLTTGFRFHPVELLLGEALALIVVALLGPPPGAVGFAALVVIVQDFFVHANLRIPESADGVLRLLIITPAMHRLHHSEGFDEQNTNFGTIFSFWDRLFGTYRAGHLAGSTRYGLTDMDKGSEANAVRLLLLPFRSASKETSS
jgi:sterol desaturase/sphingolipid hydroxylase (fatty acid hydroxylase superfamily)